MLRVIGLFAVEGSAIAALHRLGATDGLNVSLSEAFSGAARADESVASMLQLAALAIAYWLAITTGLYVISRLRAMPPGFAGRATLPLVRRLVDRAVAVSLTLGTLSAPLQAVASTPPPDSQPYVPQAAGLGPVPEITIDNEVVIPPGASLPLSPAAPSDIDSRRPLVSPSSAETYSVVEGDSMWSIAERHRPGGQPEDLVEYWLELIALNRENLISGDPDLIFPGETLRLPATG